MKRASRLLPVIGLIAIFLPCTSFGAVPGVETFDTDTAGFVPNTTSSVVVHAAGGGNPDGHIQTRKILDPPVFDIGALTTDPDFTGNYAAAGIGQVSVDLNFMTNNISAAWVRFRPSIVENGWLYPLTNVFPTNVWNSYAVAFNPTWTDLQAKAAGWLTDKDVNPLTDPSPSFASVLADVNSAEVRIASEGSTVVGIDNFAIAVPEPSMITLLVAGGAVIMLRRRRD